MKKLITLMLVGMMSCFLLAGCSSGGDTASSSGVQNQQATESKESSDTSSDKVADGTYAIDVTLEGGSGRASVESPATLTVADGSMTATIVWSSPNYDQMVVENEQYLPVNSDGNSTFEIPVSELDQDLAVSAETTAMGTPHMIDYTLHFDSKSMVAK